MELGVGMRYSMGDLLKMDRSQLVEILNSFDPPEGSADQIEGYLNYQLVERIYMIQLARPDRLLELKD